MPKPKTQRITLYRMKEGFSHEDLNLDQQGWEEQHNHDGVIVFTKAQEKDPSWKDYIRTYLGNLDSLKNHNNSFLLFKAHADRVYALAGGAGFHRLKEHYEDDFGLQVAARMISDNEIKTLQQKPLKGDTLQVFRTVRDYDPAFDRENYNRILRYLEGSGEFEGRKFTVSGRTPIVLRTEKSVESLDEVIEEIESILLLPEKITLPKSFKNVTDPELLEMLEARLLSDFIDFWNGNTDRDSMFLEFDDPIEQVRSSSFKVCFGHTQRNLDDFDLTLLRDELIAAGATNPELVFHKFRAQAYNEDGTCIAKVSSIKDAMTIELEIENTTYLKTGKQWVEVLDDIKSHINTQIAKIEVIEDYLPNWTDSYSNEREYLEAVSQEDRYTLMDQDFVYVEGRSKIEICDLYCEEDKAFIHVKRTWGSQSSYLYLQAVTSALSFSESSAVREVCQTKWPEHFTEAVSERRKVIIAVAAPASKITDFPNNLSYFAKLSLYNATQEMVAAGYDVKLTTIDYHS